MLEEASSICEKQKGDLLSDPMRPRCPCPWSEGEVPCLGLGAGPALWGCHPVLSPPTWAA